ncbi:unnamed protein product (macronuclear) [Paramecium tetraurelia]|uniref:AB hydrolase-1 domain-containing protein n=1 Tax=Paramecium tetraurelia TaxID=5888 RepID=A0BU08_PARTE|nr:uncharacterized protein GSPATT00032257001 [Paramecium tetraurelia]CAK62025.1 unnamed protein product [Paramecium tetraurelia]|eukprot:XP_001429423.1 hypothetical protein (macronuclear) [Paramecium tetraurelia strain d4-2]
MNILAIGLISISILTFVIYLICYILSGSIVISVAILLLCLYKIAHLICTLITFPGSVKSLYYKFTLLNLSDYFVSRTLQNLTIIINSMNPHRYTPQTIENAIQFLNIQCRSLQEMNKRNDLQNKYHVQLKLLSEELMQIPKNESLDKLQTEKKQRITSQSKQLQIFLEHYAYQMSKQSIIRRFFQHEFLCTLEQRRIEILIQNNNVERHLLKNASSQETIDCLFIKHNENGPTVLFCNPNAGYYEYMFFDCDWFRFYAQMKFNIILWNYRSFGESTGSISIENCIEDGRYVAEYFRSKQKIKTLGAHGQSLGGMVAAEVAYKMKLQFLIVDRSFSSLGQVAAAMFSSSTVRFIYNCLVSWDKPNYLAYYKYVGPKLIIQDPKDEILPYESQLQTAVVRCHFTDQPIKYSFKHSYFNQESTQYLKYFYSKILSKKHVLELCTSLQYIINLAIKINQAENKQESDNNKQYIELQNNDDDLDAAKPILSQVYSLFSLIHYCGNSLLDVMNRQANPEKIALFFGSCFAFDQQDDGEFEKCFQNFEVSCTEFLESSHYYINWGQIRTHIRIIRDISRSIIGKFQHIKQSNDYSLEMTGYTNDSDLCKKNMLGELVSVSCGHNNNLSREDTYLVQKFLLKNKLR